MPQIIERRFDVFVSHKPSVCAHSCRAANARRCRAISANVAILCVKSYVFQHPSPGFETEQTSPVAELTKQAGAGAGSDALNAERRALDRAKEEHRGA